MPDPTAIEQIRGKALETVRPEKARNAAVKADVMQRLQQRGAREAIKYYAGGGARRGMEEPGRNVIAEGNVKADSTDPARKLAQETRCQLAKDNAADANALAAGGITQLEAENIGAVADVRERVLQQIESTPWLTDIVGTMNPTQREQFADSLLNDQGFQLTLNKLYQDRMKPDAVDKIYDEMAKNISVVDVTKKIADAAAEAPPRVISNDEARKELAEARDLRTHAEEQWADSLNPTNLVAEATSQYAAESFGQVDDVLTKEAKDIDRQASKVMAEEKQAKGETEKQGTVDLAQRFETRWREKASGKDNIKDDYDAYSRGGLKALFDGSGYSSNPETKAIAEAILKNPALKKQYEDQVLASMLVRRMGAGRLTRDEVFNMATSSAVGIDKMVDAIDKFQLLKGRMAQMEKNGLIKHGFWGEMKKLTGNNFVRALMILLSLALVPAGAVVLGPALAGIAGGALGGGAAGGVAGEIGAAAITGSIGAGVSTVRDSDFGKDPLAA